eukprot:TRINITY_DN12514_c0_g1_i1.p1 TRINITY_DN12514_c0_g1~~TRINITY_DN12514_c0_g1_i1.p1  ORF type:complete len:186 (-),score=58.32 TRINITY_DN12514_c0_g1_i1:33-590(-)
MVDEVIDFDNMTLQDCLNNYNAAFTFRKFLHSLHSAENLAFWLEIEEFQLSGDGMPPVILEKRARKIYDKFIREGSDREINVDDLMRTNVEYKLEESSEIDIQLFDEMKEWVLVMLQQDCFPKFLRSEMFAQFRLNDGRIDEEDKTKRKMTMLQRVLKRKKAKNDSVEKTESMILLDRHVQRESE